MRRPRSLPATDLVARACVRNIDAGKRQRPSGPEQNAPSRLRLRPAFRLTAAEAAADRRTINLGCSVLGAWLTLGRLEPSVKTLEDALSANCAVFFSHRVKLRIEVVALPVRGKKKGRAQRLDPKNSPSRERFRPPSRRTFRFRVVLLGGLRPTGAPCPAQAETYDMGQGRSRAFSEQSSRNLR